MLLSEIFHGVVILMQEKVDAKRSLLSFLPVLPHRKLGLDLYVKAAMDGFLSLWHREQYHPQRKPVNSNHGQSALSLK